MVALNDVSCGILMTTGSEEIPSNGAGLLENQKTNAERLIAQ